MYYIVVLCYCTYYVYIFPIKLGKNHPFLLVTFRDWLLKVLSSSMCITWELVRNVQSWGLFRIYWSRINILTFPNLSVCICLLNFSLSYDWVSCHFVSTKCSLKQTGNAQCLIFTHLQKNCYNIFLLYFEYFGYLEYNYILHYRY